ncbi:MAG TPA: pyridoxal-phosphate dependent enzyme [Candidatus Aquilonibacter sp.]|nr:pyridoxal-phosphate dependent enzyme [Candidatus Aquilonibacter sp.]
MKCQSILDAIGHTPLVRLNRVAKDVPPPVYVKADYLNPGGSTKDRIALRMIDEAERKGLLKPGGTIIEATSGNTGIGLALIAAVRGYKVVFTVTDKQSREKIDSLKAFGAEVIVCPTAVEPEDPRSYYSVAKKLAREIPNSYYPNQYENPGNPEAHYHTSGPEIWEDTEGKITHFVCGLGTGGTASGAGRFLKEKNSEIKVIGVDPDGSLYYEYFKTHNIGGAHTYVVEGIGEDILPSTMDFSVLDDVVQVHDEECFVWARRLAKREGIFTGGSGGGCVSAAIQIAKSCKKSDLVVAFLPDDGSRYLSKIYNDGWMREHGYADAEVTLTAADVIRVKHQNGKTRQPVVVGPNRTVFQALNTMQSEDISQLPVFEDGRSVGTIFEDQILNLALQGKDLRKLIVREVMGPPIPQVPANAPIERVTHLLSHESPAVFVEMEEGKFEVLTKFDLMDTIAGLVGKKR